MNHVRVHTFMYGIIFSLKKGLADNIVGFFWKSFQGEQTNVLRNRGGVRWS